MTAFVGNNNEIFSHFPLAELKIMPIFAPQNRNDGGIAQLVRASDS